MALLTDMFDLCYCRLTLLMTLSDVWQSTDGWTDF